MARPWAGSASHPHRSQPIANQHHAGVHCSFSDQRLVVCLGLVNGKEMMSLFDDVMCLLPAAALEAVRGKGFRHQKLVANAFLTVSAFADFLQCAVSDVSDFHNRCVGRLSRRFSLPRCAFSSRRSLRPRPHHCRSLLQRWLRALLVWRLHLDPASQETAHWVPRCSRRGPLPAASCATEEPWTTLPFSGVSSSRSGTTGPT